MTFPSASFTLVRHETKPAAARSGLNGAATVNQGMDWSLRVGLCVGLGIAASRAEAQSVLRGTVQADSNRGYIARAEITIPSLRRIAHSSETGRYVIDLLPPGSHNVLVRAIGYRPKATVFTVREGDSATVDFVLSAIPLELPTLTVEAEASRFRGGWMNDFERRRRRGFGKFLDGEQLRSNRDLPLSTMLRTLAIRVVARPQACGGGFAAASTGEASLGAGGQRLHCLGDVRYGFASACYVSLYLDGTPLWAWDSPEPPNLDDVLTSSLEAIEVYRGSSQLPSELLASGNQCGAILLWTRVGVG